MNEHLKVRYYHHRMLREDWLNYRDMGITKGSPHVADLLAYNRKKQQFMDMYIRHYQPSPRGGMTECVIYDTLSGMQFVGYAVCSLSDNFCYRTGREVAYERAYKDYLDNVPY